MIRWLFGDMTNHTDEKGMDASTTVPDQLHLKAVSQLLEQRYPRQHEDILLTFSHVDLWVHFSEQIPGTAATDNLQLIIHDDTKLYGIKIRTNTVVAIERRRYVFQVMVDMILVLTFSNSNLLDSNLLMPLPSKVFSLCATITGCSLRSFAIISAILLNSTKNVSCETGCSGKPPQDWRAGSITLLLTCISTDPFQTVQFHSAGKINGVTLVKKTWAKFKNI